MGNKRKWTREELDEFFDNMPCGGLDPNPPKITKHYNYSELSKYLDANGKVFSDLTPEEIEMFRIEP